MEEYFTWRRSQRTSFHDKRQMYHINVNQDTPQFFWCPRLNARACLAIGMIVCGKKSPSAVALNFLVLPAGSKSATPVPTGCYQVLETAAQAEFQPGLMFPKCTCCELTEHNLGTCLTFFLPQVMGRRMWLLSLGHVPRDTNEILLLLFHPAYLIEPNPPEFS